MFKVISLTAVAVLALAATTTSQPAFAGNDGALAAGVIGGLAVGAIIGSQVNRGYGGPGYYQSGYQPGYQQGYQPVYRDCRIEREQFIDQYGRYRNRRIRVCD